MSGVQGMSIGNRVFEAAFPVTSKVTGVVLADQVKSLDWRSRKAKRKGKVSKEVVMEKASILELTLEVSWEDSNDRK